MAKKKPTKSSAAAQIKKSRIGEYQRKAKLLRKFDIYNPTLKAGQEPSEWQKRQINVAYAKFQENIDPKPGEKRFAYVKPKGAGRAAQKRFVKDAPNIKAKATKKGIFVEVHRNTVHVDAKYDASLKRYRIDEVYRKKNGKLDMRGKIVGDIDTLRLAESRLARKSKFAKNVPPGKYVFYMIDGVRIFENVFMTLNDALIGIMKYVSDRSLGQQIAFVNSISLFVADAEFTPDELNDMEAWELVHKGKLAIEGDDDDAEEE